MTTLLSRQAYLETIINSAQTTDRFNSNADWAQAKTWQARALALLAARLLIYQDMNDAKGMADTQWAIAQVKKQVQ